MENRPIHTVIWTIVVGLGGLTAHAAEPFAGGTGQPNDPYQIETAEQLLAIGADPNLSGEHFILNNDIDMDPNGPNGQIVIDSVIGSRQHPFFGGFNGNHHVVSNLTIQCEDGIRCGFIGHLKGVVQNLTLENIRLGNPGSRPSLGGAISGLNTGTIKNCHATGYITGSGQLGGLVGGNSGPITDCTARVTVTGRDRVGGLVGDNDHTILYCSSSGNVTGLHYVGGLIGHNGPGNIIESHSDCNTIGGVEVGGLVGYLGDGHITKCQAHGLVDGLNDVGGFVGVVRSRSYLSKNMASCSVFSEQVAGGFIGRILLWNVRVSECYALGEVRARNAGGFIGSAYFNDPSDSSYYLTDCYAANQISEMTEPAGPQAPSDSRAGGFIGDLTLYDSVKTLRIMSSCFWDTDRTGQIQGIRFSEPLLSPVDMSQMGLHGKTTAQMTDPNTFIKAGWNFEDTWTQGFEQDYPSLAWEHIKCE